MSNITYITSKDGISVVVSGRSTFFEKTHVNYEKAKELIVQKDMAGLAALTIQRSTVLNDVALAEFDGVEVFKNTAFFNGLPLSRKLAEKMIETATEGLPIEPLVALLKNIQLNPSNRCVEGFFAWLDKNHLSYTDDGHFLAYKIVQSNFKDCYTGTFDNSPGKIVEVPRNTVNDDPEYTCAHGLHGCGMEYLPHYGNVYGSDKIVCIKVNPAHLVAFPTDYKHSKFRCHRYEVIEEIPVATAKEYFNRAPVGPRTSDLEDGPATPVMDPSANDADFRIDYLVNGQWEELFGHDCVDIDEARAYVEKLDPMESFFRVVDLSEEGFDDADVEDEDDDDVEDEDDIVELEIVEYQVGNGWELYEGHGYRTLEECQQFVKEMNDLDGEGSYRIKPDTDGGDTEASSVIVEEAPAPSDASSEASSQEPWPFNTGDAAEDETDAATAASDTPEIAEAETLEQPPVVDNDNGGYIHITHPQEDIAPAPPVEPPVDQEPPLDAPVAQEPPPPVETAEAPPAQLEPETPPASGPPINPFTGRPVGS